LERLRDRGVVHAGQPGRDAQERRPRRLGLDRADAPHQLGHRGGAAAPDPWELPPQGRAAQLLLGVRPAHRASIRMYSPRRYAIGSASSPSLTCSMTASTAYAHPTRRGSPSGRRTPAHALAPRSTGPHAESSHLAIRNGPPGAGATPAKASARARSGHPRTWTTAVRDTSSASQRSESGSTSASTRAGSPSATTIEEIVRPARCPPRPDDVHSVTGAASRPRRRRTGSRSGSGVANGWSEWIVTATSSPTRASAPTDADAAAAAEPTRRRLHGAWRRRP